MRPSPLPCEPVNKNRPRINALQGNTVERGAVRIYNNNAQQMLAPAIAVVGLGPHVAVDHAEVG